MTPDIKAYLSVMEEIKKRIEVVTSFGTGKIIIEYQVPLIESMVLQLRIILELIAFGSLAANKNIFESKRKKINNHWRLSKILKDIEQINPRFYPVPLEEKKSDTGGALHKLVNLEDGFLTIDELVEIHGRCGSILHAKNPYKNSVDYIYYKNMMPKWISKITNLLSVHKIQLLDDDKFYLIHMKEKIDNRVHFYEFGKISS